MSLLKNITTTELPNTDMIKFVVDAKANIVVSTPPGLGTVSSIMEALNAVEHKILILDPMEISDLGMGLGYLDRTAEIIVVDEVHLASPMVREQIAELMQKHTLGEEEFPALKSVVVIFSHRNPETDRYAAQLTKLAPTLAITLD